MTRPDAPAGQTPDTDVVVPVGTDAVAGVLLHRRVPAAFVPPAAVLLAHREL